MVLQTGEGNRGSVENHEDASCVGFYDCHRWTDSNGIRSAAKEEGGPRKRSQCHQLVFPRLEEGPGSGHWIEKPICVSDEGTNVYPVHRLRWTGKLVDRCFATTIDWDFRHERDPVQRRRLGGQTCPCCARRPLFWRISVTHIVGKVGRTSPFIV